MRFAYADPPYPGQAADLYANHPDYRGEVDHVELVARLVQDYPDGWALSTSARALRLVLPLCPEDAWVACWHKSNAPPIRTTGRLIWSWEPVILWRGRQSIDPAMRVKDALSCGQNYGFPGQKPPAFTRWVVELLGATSEDTIDDLFAGSGAVAMTLAEIRVQPRMSFDQVTLDGEPGRVRRRYTKGMGTRHRGI